MLYCFSCLNLGHVIKVSTETFPKVVDFPITSREKSENITWDFEVDMAIDIWF